MFVMVFTTGAVTDRLLRATNSLWATRVPLAVGGFIVAALFLVIAARASGPWTTVALLCVSLGAVGVVWVEIWSACQDSACQDLAGRYTATVSGWTNFWGNLTAAFGPIFTA
jgi:ACS family glucarate transporter-like MFS transporter